MTKENAKKDINSLYSNMHQTRDELDKSLKNSLLKNAKIEVIDNSKPSEALECLEEIENYINNITFAKDLINQKQQLLTNITTIKQALLKSQEQVKELKALEIIKKYAKNNGWSNGWTIEFWNMSKKELKLVNEVLIDD